MQDLFSPSNPGRIRHPPGWWCVTILVLASATVTRRGVAQSPDPGIAAHSAFAVGEYVAGDAPISFTLSRVPLPEEGRIAVRIGSAELTPLFVQDGATLTFRGRGMRLPPGEHELLVYLVREAEWREIGRFPLKVLTRAGFSTATIDPSLALTNKGQLAEGHSGAAIAPERERYQDLGTTAGLQTTHVRGAWTLRTQTNLVGANRRQDALRFGIKGADAPKFDLSDFVIRLERPGAQLAAGHVYFGGNRHLIDNFASRGITAAFTRGRASLTLGTMNGSSVVGWDNLTGLSDGSHRINAAVFGVDVLPQKLGTLRVDISLLDGSLRPVAGFSQGTVLDAERSDGYGFQFSGATVGQRIRIGGGITRSRFNNPNDPQLSGDTSVVATRVVSKIARYADASIAVLQGRQLLIAPVSLTASLKHERVDPLYRSVATYTRADQEQNTLDLSGSIGVVSIQVAHSSSRDNLDDITSILTTHNKSTAAQATAPLAGLFKLTRHATLLPTVSWSRQEMRQYGAGIPANSEFQASHVPDQKNIINEAAANWQTGRWRFGYRFNQSEQDNRQPGREKADFTARTSALTVGVTARANLEFAVEANLERQENHELSQVGKVRRAGLSTNWAINPLTSVAGSITFANTVDRPLTNDADNTEWRVEIARTLNLRTQGESTTRGQLFLRFARQNYVQSLFGDPQFLPPSQSRTAWTLSSGASLTLF